MANDKTILVVRVDTKVMDALDRLGGMSNSNTSEAMRRHLYAIQCMAGVVNQGKTLDACSLQTKLAKALLSEASDASPEALQFIAGVWSKAAELRKQEVSNKL